MKLFDLLLASCALSALSGCTRATEEQLLVSAGARPVPAAALRSELEGKVLHGISYYPRFSFYFHPTADGRLRAQSGNTYAEALAAPSDRNSETWRVSTDGALCLRWDRWKDGAERCLRVYQSGRKFQAYLANGALALAFRVDAEAPAAAGSAPTP